ncbi:MAG: hypothetical protein EZS28_018818 [Streblomastix strix]|uniref:Uncharacterized protein n=1 Tax=Streblomastix strix TaxID=222440 RepID=A0A5J4VU15_9EUKA|nr:MAG: hypothetical protein EZS28_018818 [Streblomastix strix]
MILFLLSPIQTIRQNNLLALIFPPVLNENHEIPGIPDILTEQVIKVHMHKWILKRFGQIRVGQDENEQCWPRFGPNNPNVVNWRRQKIETNQKITQENDPDPETTRDLERIEEVGIKNKIMNEGVEQEALIEQNASTQCLNVSDEPSQSLVAQDTTKQQASTVPNPKVSSKNGQKRSKRAKANPLNGSSEEEDDQNPQSYKQNEPEDARR